MNKNGNIMKYMTFCEGIKGDGASKSKKNNINYISLVDIQLDAQNSCLFTYNTFMYKCIICK